jgi:hypothetical protein
MVVARLYPSRGRGRTATIAGDLAVVVLVALFAWAGVKVHDAVAELASLGRDVRAAGDSVQGGARDAGGAIRTGLGGAADAIDGAPLVGAPVGDALRRAGESSAAAVERRGNASARRLQARGRAAERRALATARLLGWLAFLVPTGLLALHWLPRRIAQARRLVAAHRLFGPAPLDPARERVLAGRAAYGLPLGRLLRFTPDPFGDLAAGRHDRLLAALADDAGVRPPREAAR